MNSAARYLKTHKRFWVPPIIVFYVTIATIAWKAANVSASPFVYSLF
jgi:hypothetical protein